MQRSSFEFFKKCCDDNKKIDFNHFSSVEIVDQLFLISLFIIKYMKTIDSMASCLKDGDELKYRAQDLTSFNLDFHVFREIFFNHIQWHIKRNKGNANLSNIFTNSFMCFFIDKFNESLNRFIEIAEKYLLSENKDIVPPELLIKYLKI